MASSDEEPPKAQGEAAHKALRKHFPTLMKIVASGDIVENLYAEEIIEESTFEVVTAPGTLMSNKQKGTKILKDVQVSVHSKPKAFETFCQVLKSENHAEAVFKLRDTYTKCLEIEEDKLEKDAGVKKSEFCSEVQELKRELDFYNKRLALQTMTPESFYQCVQYGIQQAIEKALKAGNEEEAIRNQLWSLCHKDFDVPTNLRDWAMQEVEEICKRTTASMNQTLITPASILPDEKVEPPLFSKDTLYHASLCCHAVSVCTAGNYEVFLNSKSHLLKEASMSISQCKENVDRYIIAKCGNTIFVAFQSEPTLSNWMDSPYTSFIDGLEKETNRIPLRFFWELLSDKKRLVLTGFSFGGMLACYVAANLWKTSFISGDVLEKNVVCITFGQPLIPIPYVEEAIKAFPQFEATIHAVYDKDDFFPRVLYYYNVGCKHYYDSNQAIKTFSQTIDRPQAASLLASNTMKFSTPFARKFLRCLAIIQEQTYSGATANSSTPPVLSDFKKMLSEIIPHAEKYPSKAFGNGYVITAIEGKGIQWMSMHCKVISETGILRISSSDKLDVASFKKHTMAEYGSNSFRSYLDREPDKFTVPGPVEAVKEVKAINMLKPKATRVEFHMYPNEHVVVLEGENLWFCHKIRLGEFDNILDIKTPAQNVTQRMIQFNFPPYEKLKSLVSEGVVKVTLHSHFANPIRQNIQVMQEPYSFNLRQIQLAKNTPTEVIQLAFLSAMLEQYPERACGKGPSERLKDVTHFLEEAVKVVPIESIFTAIAYMDDDTSLECAKAIVAAQPKIPPSLMMFAGAQRAVLRMRTGVPAQITDILIDVLTRGIISSRRCVGMPIISISAPKHNQIKVTVSTPVGFAPQSYSDIIQRNVPELIWDTIESTEDLPPLPPELNATIATHPKLADRLDKYAVPLSISEKVCNLISNLSIEHVYPVDSHRRYATHISTLQSPLEVLRDAREKITSFIEDSQQEDHNTSQGTQSSNEQMLTLVRDINEHILAICAALLGAFMEQQIRIPLIKSEIGTAGVLSEMTSPVAMGVWALFSMGFEELQDKLSSLQGDPLFVEIADYISGVLSDNLQKPSHRSSKYDGKLQFLLQGIKRTVSCSSQYISYSLEHQLCSNLKFDKGTTIKKLIDSWDEIFHGDALSLVAKSHRPLIARWLKWAILIHDLRESLAKYTCVGVTGLVNSGKSQLVSRLFGVQAAVGTTEHKRTTVPLLYNLDGKVDGLDVIDFPGVDDKDHSIPELAQLLLGLVQVVIFVVDYKRIFCDVAKQWLHFLEAEDVPVVVCMTHADLRYNECMENEDGNPEPTPFKIQEIGADLMKKTQKITHHPSRTVGFYCFYLPPGYKPEVNAENLKKVGIGGHREVGDELVKIFRDKLDQKDLADKLEKFVHRDDSN